MTLRYTRRALANLEAALAYLAERSPQGADHVAARLETVIGIVAEHPLSGSPTSNPRVRRIAATPYPYLVFYEAKGADVVITGIRHASRRPLIPGRGRV